MDEETATPLEAPVETPAAEPEQDALAKFLAEDDTPTEANPEDTGDSDKEPATEGEAQKADEANPAEQPPEEQPKYKVKVRGEELEVPLSELLNGYSRTEDYKAKTAEVAELRRQTETEYADKLNQQLQQFIAIDPILAQAQNLDWNALAQTDPTAYVQFKAQYDARVAMFGEAAREVDQIKSAEQQRMVEATQEYHKAEREALVAAVPELREPAKMTEFARGIVDYLKTNGFPEEVIMETDDHRAWLIADKARKWDALQTAKTTVESKKTAPKHQPTLGQRAAESPRAPKRPGPQANDDARRAWVLAQLDAE